ncbi:MULTISPECIES: hypothetical protein [Brucella]|uniref:Acyl transferase domain-containing protein n=1 Tax=Brucella pecoris TaxID=867683 RepID=A0A5C5CVR1_9HYPH|nr:MULTISPECIES: hypothetical protein [Brucella]RNL46702.1 hypothetical protein D7I41_06200 [Ochrobactrum sp. MH181795]MBB4092350.1 acyl transferase domain-containing protein [Brucella pecoris]MCR8492931.1 hypothetical protein [Brucella anthropi]MDG9792227.1 hypothetical protein [Brucella anthropi]MDH0581137.1 hypothetical protein [Brucella anthropi]
MKTGKIWTIDEFISDTSNVLSSAAVNGPQFLVANGKTYRIEAVEDAEADKVRDILSDGGPLEDGDRLD